jgi:hypothetical protein
MAQPTTDNPAARALLREVSGRMQQLLERAEHCFRQLDEEQVWYRAHPLDNSIGNLVLHVVGSLGQWVLSGLGGADAARDRPAEFRAAGGPGKAELQALLARTIAACRQVIDSLPPESLVERRRIQGTDSSVSYAVVGAAAHTALHVGQMLFITKALRGDRYQESWTPATREQGA